MTTERKGKQENRTEAMFLEYFQTGDTALRNELVEAHLFMVDRIISNYSGKGVERDDLRQVGALALIHAVERFDPTRGFKFTTFATPTIDGELKKYFRDKGWSMKVPRGLKEIYSAIPKVKEELQRILGRTPTPKEIADHMGRSEEQVLEAMEGSLAYAPESLNSSFAEEGDEKERFENLAATSEEGYEDFEIRDMVESVLSDLSDVSRFIFRKRFVEGKTQEEIAGKLHVSQMTVSRAEKRLRERLAEELHQHQ